MYPRIKSSVCCAGKQSWCGSNGPCVFYPRRGRGLLTEEVWVEFNVSKPGCYLERIELTERDA